LTVVGVFSCLGDLDIEVAQEADGFLFHVGDRVVE